MNLSELLDQAARSWPQKTALIEGNNSVSYSTLAAQTEELASLLRNQSLRPGSRIGLSYQNSIDYVALTFALWRINAVVVPIPTECTEEELSEIAETMELDAIFSHGPRPLSFPLRERLFFTRLVLAKPSDNHGLNIAFIRFTSGTTSARKGVVLCHETIRDRILSANKALGIRCEDTVIWSLPMSHHFLITIVLYLSKGASIVLARHTLARPYIEAVNQWRGTVLYAAPFHYGLLARDASDIALPSVRLAVSTTCSLPEDVAKDFQRRFGIPLVQALGIIELGLVSLNTGDPNGRWNSVGRSVPEVQVRIHNADSTGVGEVEVLGPGFFDAYAAPWMSREQVLRKGWFNTGDIGRIDEDGFLYLVGRKTAVINLAGRKVFPEEIEAVLNRHPNVSESRVYGRVHPHLGEVVEADLVLHSPDADLGPIREFCRAHLASFKIPSRLRVVCALPRTAATGKISRAAAAA